MISDNTKKAILKNKTANTSSLSSEFQDIGIQSKRKIFGWMNTYPVIMFAIIVVMGLTTCQKDDDPEPDNNFCGTAWTTYVQEEISNLSDATMVWVNDPTVANCNAYKAAYETYIDALEPYGNCTTFAGSTKAQWEAALQEARNDLAELNCEEESN